MAFLLVLTVDSSLHEIRRGSSPDRRTSAREGSDRRGAPRQRAKTAQGGHAYFSGIGSHTTSHEELVVHFLPSTAVQVRGDVGLG